jgi:hypothetical protein
MRWRIVVVSCHDAGSSTAHERTCVQQVWHTAMSLCNLLMSSRCSDSSCCNARFAMAPMLVKIGCMISAYYTIHVELSHRQKHQCNATTAHQATAAPHTRSRLHLTMPINTLVSPGCRVLAIKNGSWRRFLDTPIVAHSLSLVHCVALAHHSTMLREQPIHTEQPLPRVESLFVVQTFRMQ